MLKTSTTTKEPKTTVLLGIPFHDISMAETLDWIARVIERRTPSYLVTANLDFAAQASEDKELQRILFDADVVLCDGTPLVWVSRLTHHPLRERVAGSDLAPKLAARAAAEGWRLFLLGGEESSLQAATSNLKAKHPDLVIAGTYSPPFAPLDQMNHGEIARRIKRAAPDILLVAFGCPKQEKWIYQHYRNIGVPCCIGIGATIDFLAGKVRRAPAWIAALGLEWVFRLAQEPRRLAGRYIKDIIFLITQLTRESLVFRRSRKDAQSAASHVSIQRNDVEILAWQGPLIAGTVDQLSVPFFSLPFIIDISKVTLLDSRGLGHLLKTLRVASKNGSVGCFVAPSVKVRSILEMTRLDRVIPIAPTIDAALKLLNREQLGSTRPPVLDAEKHSILLVMPQYVTSETTLECQEELFKAWLHDPVSRILQLDFGATLHMDNSGLGFVVRCHHLVNDRAGGELKLRNLPPNVMKIIKMARLEKLLTLSWEQKNA